jgi:hypothetical protein
MEINKGQGTWMQERYTSPTASPEEIIICIKKFCKHLCMNDHGVQLRHGKLDWLEHAYKIKSIPYLDVDQTLSTPHEDNNAPRLRPPYTSWRSLVLGWHHQQLLCWSLLSAWSYRWGTTWRTICHWATSELICIAIEKTTHSVPRKKLKSNFYI